MRGVVPFTEVILNGSPPPRVGNELRHRGRVWRVVEDYGPADDPDRHHVVLSGDTQPPDYFAVERDSRPGGTGDRREQMWTRWAEGLADALTPGGWSRS